MTAGSTVLRLIAPFRAFTTLTVAGDAGAPFDGAGAMPRQPAGMRSAPPSSHGRARFLGKALMIARAPLSSFGRLNPARLPGLEGARARAPARLQDREHGRKDAECRQGRGGEAADDRAAEGSRLLAPLAEANRHGDHPGD